MRGSEVQILSTAPFPSENLPLVSRHFANVKFVHSTPGQNFWKRVGECSLNPVLGLNMSEPMPRHFWHALKLRAYFKFSAVITVSIRKETYMSEKPSTPNHTRVSKHLPGAAEALGWRTRAEFRAITWTTLHNPVKWLSGIGASVLLGWVHALTGQNFWKRVGECSLNPVLLLNMSEPMPRHFWHALKLRAYFKFSAL